VLGWSFRVPTFYSDVIWCYYQSTFAHCFGVIAQEPVFSINPHQSELQSQIW
jgi:hypothetical protein